ncbi:GIY-YIG nuclease family protein [Pedobacter sp. Leaf170]|uniref:GIY-YIG nuclease family protein n=1 Tax=Pedobacter sp. Leaf170 TaxID=2876558 RepID=UPI001E5FD1D2|nr:GIY-YIG nuclease family protein [Pedobacter sp. Leaf170]
MDIFYVYAIKSEIDGRIYVGFSSDVEKRLHEHNVGKTKSSKGYKPWVLIYTEQIKGRIAARDKEKYYKSGKGKEFLKSL